MFNPDEETIECTDGNKEFFLAQQESRERFLFLTFGARGIYLFPTLGTVKFN